MIPIFIPSKDRAAQLDLLLRSLGKNAPGLFSPTILYTHSNDEFAAGYQKLRAKYSDLKWLLEYDACDQFYRFLSNEDDNVVGLFTDDSIFYRKTNFNEFVIEDIFENKDIWSLHFRLGENINTSDYINDKKISLPPNMVRVVTDDYNNTTYLEWNYRQAGDKFESYFAFPTPFDGSLYRASDLLDLAGGQQFEKMILWEAMICQNGRQQNLFPSKLIAPELSEVVCMQWNSSHNYGFRTSGAVNHSLKDLNDRFLDDYIIDIDSMDFSNVNCCHQEIPFQWSVSNS